MKMILTNKAGKLQISAIVQAQCGMDAAAVIEIENLWNSGMRINAQYAAREFQTVIVSDQR
jgi:hypothetical protein